MDQNCQFAKAEPKESDLSSEVASLLNKLPAKQYGEVDVEALFHEPCNADKNHDKINNLNTGQENKSIIEVEMCMEFDIKHWKKVLNSVAKTKHLYQDVKQLLDKCLELLEKISLMAGGEDGGHLAASVRNFELNVSLLNDMLNCNLASNQDFFLNEKLIFHFVNSKSRILSKGESKLKEFELLQKKNPAEANTIPDSKERVDISVDKKNINILFSAVLNKRENIDVLVNPNKLWNLDVKKNNDLNQTDINKKQYCLECGGQSFVLDDVYKLSFIVSGGRVKSDESFVNAKEGGRVIGDWGDVNYCKNDRFSKDCFLRDYCKTKLENKIVTRRIKTPSEENAELEELYQEYERMIQAYKKKHRKMKYGEDRKSCKAISKVDEGRNLVRPCRLDSISWECLRSRGSANTAINPIKRDFLKENEATGKQVNLKDEITSMSCCDNCGSATNSLWNHGKEAQKETVATSTEFNDLFNDITYYTDISADKLNFSLDSKDFQEVEDKVEDCIKIGKNFCHLATLTSYSLLKNYKPPENTEKDDSSIQNESGNKSNEETNSSGSKKNINLEEKVELPPGPEKSVPQPLNIRKINIEYKEYTDNDILLKESNLDMDVGDKKSILKELDTIIEESSKAKNGSGECNLDVETDKDSHIKIINEVFTNFEKSYKRCLSALNDISKPTTANDVKSFLRKYIYLPIEGIKKNLYKASISGKEIRFEDLIVQYMTETRNVETEMPENPSAESVKLCHCSKSELFTINENGKKSLNLKLDVKTNNESLEQMFNIVHSCNGVCLEKDRVIGAVQISTAASTNNQCDMGTEYEENPKKDKDGSYDQEYDQLACILRGYRRNKKPPIEYGTHGTQTYYRRLKSSVGTGTSKEVGKRGCPPRLIEQYISDVFTSKKASMKNIESKSLMHFLTKYNLLRHFPVNTLLNQVEVGNQDGLNDNLPTTSAEDDKASKGAELQEILQDLANIKNGEQIEFALVTDDGEDILVTLSILFKP